ncbi:hypothetical protein [uncultured Methanomethylovorans sp.]|uniref:hypothetical protein n=1 Tax=uncultured Methanomethylovorans sp. TaxID=183759 RepID=UPI002AA6FA8C|nr:hypothetical protein [uncultured Methanomethylovorans sp.]
MSTPIKVTPEQYARWMEHLTGAGKCRNQASTNPRRLTPEREEIIVKAWKDNECVIKTTCRVVKCSGNTVRTVLKARGLIL